jgi:hypothetical protein
MIRTGPQDFLDPQAAVYLSSNVRKVDLHHLEPLPVLFHSGYLTIDKKIFTQSKFQTPDGEPVKQTSYTFKFPNIEVAEGYGNLLKTTFGEAKYEALVGRTSVFLDAVDSRDSVAVAEWFTNVLSAVSFYQHTPDESFYHVILQGCLVSGGLKVLAELAGAMGRSDIIVERPGERYLIIELKYRKKEEGHTESDLKKELAKASKGALEQIVKNDCAGPVRGRAKEIIGLSVAVYEKKDVRADFVTENLMKPRPTR